MNAGYIIGIIGAVIGIIGTVSGLVFSFKSNSRTDKQDSEDDGREIGKILSDLGYIKLAVDNIQVKVDRQEARHLDITNKLTSFEGFKDLANARFARIEEELNTLHGQVDKLHELHESIH